MTFETFVENNFDKPWNWTLLSSNPMITLECIERNASRDWDWLSLSSSPIITPEFIEKYLDKPLK